MGWARNSYLGPAETASFSTRDLGRSNKHDTFWHVVWTGYFYILISWPIAVSDFLPLEIYENIGPPLFSITFTVNTHVDKFSINKFVSNINKYEINFFIKMHVEVFYIQIWFNSETPPLCFLIKAMVYRKLCEKYRITCCTHMMSYAIWVDEITGVMISVKWYWPKFSLNW